MNNKISYMEINSNGRCLRGMVHHSQTASSIPIIIVHGYFSANKIGPQRLSIALICLAWVRAMMIFVT